MYWPSGSSLLSYKLKQNEKCNGVEERYFQTEGLLRQKTACTNDRNIRIRSK